MKKPWYKTWWGILLIILFWPIAAIWAIWAKTSWGQAQKILATVGVFIIAITISALASSDEQSNLSQDATQESVSTGQTTAENKVEQKDTAKAKAENKNETKSIVKYEVANIEDLSFANTVRLGYNVVVKEKASKEDLKNLAQHLVEKIKKDKKFNAVVIGFYDYPEYIGRGYTLGKAEYAPEGDWSKAMDVRTGDYSSFSYNYELKEKNWSAQLTPEEVKIWARWYAVSDKENEKDPTSVPDEEKITATVAQEFSTDVETVKAILSKQSVWMFMDN